MAEGFTLVTGGARSGKSAYAERLAAGSGKPVLFVATAEARDEDMRQRIEEHRANRPAEWQTIEEPLSVAVAIRAGIGGSQHTPVVLLDCVTLLVSNLLLAGRPVQPEIEALVQWRNQSGARLIAVTNEVGLGIVPDNALARQYRDALGLANQMLAAAADQVILMVAGLAVAIKRPR
ncbi:MAG TPA: bifunctional adenosylcobinamide kinase/adenosylcobinamide-phosphate guanylyltransferase [Chloroflexota bacterium]